MQHDRIVALGVCRDKGHGGTRDRLDALDGLGVAMGPTALVEDDIAEGRLVRPFAGPALAPWRYVTYVAASRFEDRSIQAFRDWLRSTGGAAASAGE